MHVFFSCHQHKCYFSSTLYFFFFIHSMEWVNCVNWYWKHDEILLEFRFLVSSRLEWECIINYFWKYYEIFSHIERDMNWSSVTNQECLKNEMEQKWEVIYTRGKDYGKRNIKDYSNRTSMKSCNMMKKGWHKYYTH